jgi:hypothetical protein
MAISKTVSNRKELVSTLENLVNGSDTRATKLSDNLMQRIKYALKKPKELTLAILTDLNSDVNAELAARADIAKEAKKTAPKPLAKKGAATEQTKLPIEQPQEEPKKVSPKTPAKPEPKAPAKAPVKQTAPAKSESKAPVKQSAKPEPKPEPPKKGAAKKQPEPEQPSKKSPVKTAKKSDTVAEKGIAPATMFPDEIEIPDVGTLAKIPFEGTFDELRELLTDEDKTMFIVGYWTARHLKKYNYGKNFDVPQPQSFPLDLDVAQIVLVCEQVERVWASSIYTEAMQCYIAEDFNYIEAGEGGDEYKVRAAQGMEFELYQQIG